MIEPEITYLSDATALAEAAARQFADYAREALARQGRFTVALAGGSTPAGLYRLLTAEPWRNRIAWDRTFIFFGDERCVPPDSPDSNYRMARETLLDHAPIPAANIFPMRCDSAEEAAQGAEDYSRLLHTRFDLPPGALPHFDLILLGMGDDGHTASLFPGMPGLNEAECLVIAADVPGYVRPQVARLTLTLPVLNAAAHVMFLVAGEKKRPALNAVLTNAEPADPLPARRVRPTDGTLTWFVAM
jgi:6-phosphogluconolactonase